MDEKIEMTKAELYDTVKNAVADVVGEQVAGLVPGIVANELKAKGIDENKVDRDAKIAFMPETKEYSKVADLTEKSVEFLKAVFKGDLGQIRDLSEGTDADGGYLVPTDLRSLITRKINDRAVFRTSGATVIPMNTDKMDNPFESTQVTTYWVDENAEITQSDPAFGNEQLQIHTLAGLSRMSRQLVSDAKVNILDVIVDMFVQAIAREEDDKFMVGTGTLQPKGLRAYSIGSVAQSGTNLEYDDLTALVYEADEGYRNDPTACFLMHKDAIKLITGLKDSANRPIFGAGDISKGLPATLLGYPIREMNAIPTNLGAGSNTTEIYFGAMRYYLIGDREQVGVETSTQEGDSFKKHRMAVKVYERVDGRLGLTDAFKKLTGVK